MPDPQRSRQVLSIGMPIMGGMVSQSVLNLVDAAMVGSLGEVPLAAVGVGSYANFMAVALVIGLSSGVQAMVARRKGEGRLSAAAVPLNGGLALALLLALPLMALFLSLAADIIAVLNADPRVRAEASAYFQARVCGMLFLGFNFCFRGYWNGLGLSRYYMGTLIVMHSCNIVISYGLIFGRFGLPALGTLGAGVGTSIALGIGSLIYLGLTLRHGRVHGFLAGIPDAITMRTMLRLSIPNSLQQLFFAAGITALIWIIGLVGTQELAVAHVLINLALFLILPGIGLGIAATTLVSEALGRGDPEDAHRWGWDVFRLACCVLALLGLPLWLVPDLVMSVFVHEQALLDIGRAPVRATGLLVFLDALSIVMMQSLLGAGANRTVLFVSLSTQWLLFLPAAFLIGPVLGGNLLAIWLAQLAQRGLSGMIFARYWNQRAWVRIKL